MAEYHTTYRGPEGRTTEWDDIQIKMGNKAPRPKREKAPKFAGEYEEAQDSDWVRRLDEDELSDIEDDLEDDRALKVLREQRIKQLQEAKQQPLFGTMDFIRATDFRQRVTEASAKQWVVVTLYKDNMEECTCLLECMAKLASQHPRSQFLKMISTDCIPDLPDSKLPTVLVYHEKACKKTFAGPGLWGGKRATEEYAALLLNEVGPICQRGQDESQENMMDRGVQQLVKKLVLQRQEQDEDSEFSE